MSNEEFWLHSLFSPDNMLNFEELFDSRVHFAVALRMSHYEGQLDVEQLNDVLVEFPEFIENGLAPILTLRGFRKEFKIHNDKVENTRRHLQEVEEAIAQNKDIVESYGVKSSPLQIGKVHLRVADCLEKSNEYIKKVSSNYNSISRSAALVVESKEYDVLMQNLKSPKTRRDILRASFPTKEKALEAKLEELVLWKDVQTRKAYFQELVLKLGRKRSIKSQIGVQIGSSKLNDFLTQFACYYQRKYAELYA